MCKTSVLICVTGASGSVYAKGIFDILKSENIPFDVIFSKYGKEVFSYELDIKTDTLNKYFHENTKTFHCDEMFSRPASGSCSYDKTIIVPASSGTIGYIASGAVNNLIHRAALVSLKEEKKLIICPRETPLNNIDLENLLKLKNGGATIFPLSPSFYFKPKSLDEIIDNTCRRILSVAGIETKKRLTWN